MGDITQDQALLCAESRQVDGEANGVVMGSWKVPVGSGGIPVGSVEYGDASIVVVMVITGAVE